MDSVCLRSANNEFISRLCELCVNSLFVELLQPRILSWKSNLPAARTAIQYLVFFLENISSPALASCVYRFVFGSSHHLHITPISSEDALSGVQEDSPTGKEKVGLLNKSVAIGQHLPTSLLPSDGRDEDGIYIGHLDAHVQWHGDQLALHEDYFDTKEGPEEKKHIRIQSHGSRLSTENLDNWLVADETQSPSQSKPDKSHTPMHNPKAIASFVLGKLNSDEDFCSPIILQFFDRLLSFHIPDMLSLLITNYLQLYTKVCIKTN